MHTTWPSGHVQLMGSHFSLEPRAVKVHSVFHSALNLIDGSNSLYTLCLHKEQLHPSSALVSFSDHVSSFDEFAFTKAEQGMFTEGSLYFDCGIWVSLQGAKRTHPSEEIAPKLVSLEASYFHKQMMFLSGIQQKKQTSLTVESLFATVSEPNTLSSLVSFHAKLLKESMQTADIALAKRGIEGLLGLGPGSTPSGDDFICGFFLALHMGMSLSFMQDVHSFCRDLSEVLSSLVHRPRPITTDISLQLLGLASEGLFSQPLIAMAKSFSSLDADRSTWEALASYGHSSGLDAGLGFLFALSILLPDFEYKGEVC